MTSMETLPLTPQEKTRKKALAWRNSSETAAEQSPTSQTTNGRQVDPALSAWKKTAEAMKLRDWVKQGYAKCKADRLRIQRRWDIHWEFYSGEHWMQFVNGTLQARSMPKYRVKATVNHIRPIIRTEISRMTSQKPSASITPGSGSDEDIFAAQAGEQVWESFYDRKDVHSLLSECALWVAVTGNGFIKCVWDSNLVDPTFKNTLGEPEPGDIRYGVITPYHLFVPDLNVTNIEDQPYVFEVYTKPVEWVKHYFGGLLEYEVSAKICAKTEILENRYFNGNQGKEAVPDSVLVIEAYVKAGSCSFLPNGGMVTIVGDEIVQVVQEFPFSHGNYPYVHIRHIPTGKFYGDSVLVDLIPLQMEYNGTISHIVESKRRMGKPQLLVPKGSMDQTKYTSEPGLLIPYNPALGEPKPLKIQELPGFVMQEPGRIMGDMQTISGQHEVSKGQAPGSGVTAATAISFLQEKDETMMRVTYDSIESGMTKLARLTLQNVVDFWTIPRIVRTTGPDGAFDAVELKGSQISYDIKIEAGSSLPTSKAARQAFLMELFTSQAITADMLLDLIDMGGTAKLTEQVRVDMRQAQRENVKMKKLTEEDIMLHELTMQEQFAVGGGENQGPDGAPLWNGDPNTWPSIVEVHDYDNHEVHVRVHDNFRKGQEFEMLSKEVQAQFEKHIQMHKMQLARMQMGQMMGGMPPMGQGTPPPGMDVSGQMPPDESGQENQFSQPETPMEGGMPNG